MSLPVEVLVPGFDFRIDEIAGDLADLAASIAEHGVLQPLLVRRVNDEWEVVAGRRRLAAARQAGLDHVPCVVRDLGDDQAVDATIAENIHRRNLSPIEEALAYAHLRDTGLTQAAIAKRVGRSQTTVCHLLKLIEFPADVRAEVHAGRLSYFTVVRHPDRFSDGLPPPGERQGGGRPSPRPVNSRRSRVGVVLASPPRPAPRRPLRHPEIPPHRQHRVRPHARPAHQSRRPTDARIHVMRPHMTGARDAVT